MTKISSKTAYPKKKPISSDYFVGTDSEDFNKTVNFGFEEVAGLVNDLNGTPILNYVFSTSPYLSTEVLLEGRFLSDENELSTPSLTKLYINKFNNSGDNLQELYLFLQTNATDFYLKLRNSNNQNNAVYFDIASIEDFPDYFILNITVFKENEFLPLLENLNVYFFDFELKATSAGTSDPLKLDKDGYTGTAKNIDDRILVLENQTDIDNAFIVKPTFALATNILTINALGKWKLEGVIYENLTNVTFPIAYCATGKTRLDYFVPNNANGFDKISGVETLGVAIAPQLPNEGLYVTYILVSDSGVGEPVTPPSVVIPNLHQVLGSGFSTTRYIWFFNNINSLCTRFASDHILFQKLESVFNFIRADNTTQSYNIQLPNKIGGAEQTFAMVSDLTKSQVGLSNVDNTSDATKPVSGPQQTALDGKQAALGFTPENLANKSDSYTTSSSITYASTKALVDGLATKQNTLTNPITGTGTTNTIPKFTASGTVGNSSITDNGSLVTITNPTTFIGLNTIQGTAASDGGQLGSELTTTATGTNWTGTGFATGYTHTTGSVIPLTSTLAAVTNNLYQITWTITGRTTGSVTINYGGIAITGNTASGNSGPKAISTATLNIVPTTDFNGTVVVSVKVISASSTTQTWLNSSGVVVNELRASSNNTNLFFGMNAGSRNTTGDSNSAIGQNALLNNTTGNNNCAVGQNALGNNTTGRNNVATGEGALLNNTTGRNNIATGEGSGRYIDNKSTPATILNNSIMLGYRTSPLADNQTNQVVIGYDATGLGSNTTVIGNSSTVQTWVGGRLTVGSTVDDSTNALQLTGTAKLSTAPTTSASTYDFLTRNTSTGVVEKILSNTIATVASPTFTGTPTAPTATVGTNTTQIATTAFVLTNGNAGGVLEYNTANKTVWNNGKGNFPDNTSFGDSALANNTSPYNNAFGTIALYSNTSGSQNSGFGIGALYSNTTGSSNVSFGNGVLHENTTYSNNSALGYNALYSINIGGNNTALGCSSGRYLNDKTSILTNISNSLLIGSYTSALANGDTNEIVIGYNTTGAGSNTATLGDTSITKTVLRGAIQQTSYTVATLPSGVQGMFAYVTDALTPTYMTTVVGGGAVVCPVFYNGTAWVSH